MLKKPSVAVVLAIGVVACGGEQPARTSTPGQAERTTTIQAHSTVGWGCPCPPFRREHCDRNTESEKDPTECYFLTRTSEKLAEPWDFARANGTFTLVGHWSSETMTYEAWLAGQNQAPAEGADLTAKFPVFEVERYCLSPDDVSRHEGLIVELRSDRERVERRRWIRAHACR